jgi:hypothetical protein
VPLSDRALARPQTGATAATGIRSRGRPRDKALCRFSSALPLALRARVLTTSCVCLCFHPPSQNCASSRYLLQ